MLSALSGVRSVPGGAQPDEALAGLVSGYHCYWTRPPAGVQHSDVFYPGWSNLRFQLDGEPWHARIGERCFDPVPRACLFGPTARAVYAESGAGVLVGAGLTPLGWSRLTDIEAESVAEDGQGDEERGGLEVGEP